MPLPPRRVLRQFKYAMYLDGVDDYIYAPQRGIQLNQFTFLMTAWSTGCGGAYPRFFSLGDGVSIPNHFAYQVDYTGMNYLRYIDVGGSVRDVYGLYPQSPRFTYNPTMWGLSWDGSLTLKSYVNGSLYVTRTLSYQPKPIYASFRAPAYHSLGMFIVHAMLYSRVLSDSEIQWNFRNPDNPVRDGLVLWLQAHPDYVKDIDGDGVLEWIDLSGYGNHGKIYGAQLVQLIRAPARVLASGKVLGSVR